MNQFNGEKMKCYFDIFTDIYMQTDPN